MSDVRVRAHTRRRPGQRFDLTGLSLSEIVDCAEQRGRIRGEIKVAVEARDDAAAGVLRAELDLVEQSPQLSQIDFWFWARALMLEHSIGGAAAAGDEKCVRELCSSFVESEKAG